MSVAGATPDILATSTSAATAVKSVVKAIKTARAKAKDNRETMSRAA